MRARHGRGRLQSVELVSSELAALDVAFNVENLARFYAWYASQRVGLLTRRVQLLQTRHISSCMPRHGCVECARDASVRRARGETGRVWCAERTHSQPAAPRLPNDGNVVARRALGSGVSLSRRTRRYFINYFCVGIIATTYTDW